MTNKKDYTVIYIMGRGHSGSTVLDLILGNHKSITSLGELTSGFGFRYGTDDLCSCGAIVRECAFWGEIIKKLQAKYPEVKLESFSKMMDYMARFYRIPQLKTRIGLPQWVKSKFDLMIADLYSFIAQQSGNKYMVDSSKDMGYGYYLLTRLPAEVKIIHLVRDGRGVMWSRLRRIEKGLRFQFQRHYLSPKRHWWLMLLAVLSWNFANYAGIIMRLMYKGKIIQVKYEDLCMYPSRELKRIGVHIGLEMSDLSERLTKGEALEIRHLISGNQMRQSDSHTFILSTDSVWKTQLPSVYKLLFIVLSFPLALYYGYI